MQDYLKQTVLTHVINYPRVRVIDTAHSVNMLQNSTCFAYLRRRKHRPKRHTLRLTTDVHPLSASRAHGNAGIRSPGNLRASTKITKEQTNKGENPTKAHIARTSQQDVGSRFTLKRRLFTKKDRGIHTTRRNATPQGSLTLPSFPLSNSCATRVAMDEAAMARGCVQMTTGQSESKKNSAQYCGSCVVLPDPVSAITTRTCQSVGFRQSKAS